MIEVKVKISEVDYISAVDSILPVLLDRVDVPDNPLAAAALQKLKKLPTGAARAALKVLPQGTKDELAAACINHYRDKLSEKAVGMARKQGISLKVEDINVSVAN
ncbi:MAG: hypothetical protein K2O18_17200 [Oscillospiraceae bacterium]|nr:hypothetical protein [Oscillospiraceae bacterium]